MKFIIGKKLGMSQWWNKKKELEAITLIDCHNNTDNFSEVLKEDSQISVTGTSKGKGFQGVVKRHNFAGGPKTHGHRHVLR